MNTHRYQMGVYPQSAAPKSPVPPDAASDFYPRALMIAPGLVAAARIFGVGTQLLPLLAGSALVAVAMAPYTGNRQAQMMLGFGIGAFIVGSEQRPPTDMIMGGGLGMLAIAAPDILAAASAK